MNLRLITVYLTIVLYENSIAQEIENTTEVKQTFRVTDSLTRCSVFLSMALERLCNHDYKIVKRDTSLMMQKLMPKELQENTIRHKLMSTKSWRRVKRQIADECCVQPCTVGELIMYCPNEAKIFQEQPELYPEP